METYICINVSDGNVYHYAIQHEFRAAGQIVRQTDDSGVVPDSVIIPLLFRLEEGWQTRDQAERVTLVSWRRISLAEHNLFNADRLYRNALRDNAGVLAYDMPTARGLHLARLRRERDTQLDALDKDWMRATGQRDNAEANRIENSRQALRDMPTRIQPALDAARDINELQQVR